MTFDSTLLFRTESGPWSLGGVARTEMPGEEVTTRAAPPTGVTVTTGLVYDERMMEHENMWDR